MNQYSDIVRLCIRGDRLSQHKLYKLFYSKMMGVCYRYTNNAEDARDILQDGFVKVYTNLKKYNFKGSLEGWIRRIMVCTAIDYYRKKNRRPLITDYEDDFILETSKVTSPDLITSQFGEEIILKAIQSLVPSQRTSFNLHIIEGYSHKEIAQRLNITESTSKTNLFKAKEKLKKIMINNNLR